MTDVNVNEQAQEENKQENNEIDYKAWYEENAEKIKNFDAIVAKKDELLKETKKAKADRAAADAEAARIAEEKARQDGEFENLWKTAKQREDALAKELADIKTANRHDKIQNAALRIASELAEGANVELLSEFVVRNLNALADETGLLSSDVIDEVKRDYASNDRYKSLMRVNKSSGGSAPGNVKTGGITTTLNRSEFAKLDPQKQSEFVAKIRNGSANLID